MRQLYVYILASDSRELYIGVTKNLQLRIDTHRNGGGEFTSRRSMGRLVYYERLGPPIVAIAREKQLKRWKRLRKLELIESVNPTWQDLAPRADVES